MSISKNRFDDLATALNIPNDDMLNLILHGNQYAGNTVDENISQDINVDRWGNGDKGKELSSFSLPDASYTILEYQSGTSFNNTGVTANRITTLPPAVVGMEYKFTETEPGKRMFVEPSAGELIFGTSGIDTQVRTVAQGSTFTLTCELEGKWTCSPPQAEDSTLTPLGGLYPLFL